MDWVLQELIRASILYLGFCGNADPPHNFNATATANNMSHEHQSIVFIHPHTHEYVRSTPSKGLWTRRRVNPSSYSHWQPRHPRLTPRLYTAIKHPLAYSLLVDHGNWYTLLYKFKVTESCNALHASPKAQRNSISPTEHHLTQPCEKTPSIIMVSQLMFYFPTLLSSLPYLVRYLMTFCSPCLCPGSRGSDPRTATVAIFGLSTSRDSRARA